MGNCERTMRNIIKRTPIDTTVSPEEQIEEAADDVKAMARTEAGSFELYLVDWNMASMNGITLLRKAGAAGSKTPFMMCTTEAEKLKVVEAVKAGASNYTVTPFAAETLQERITQTMEKCTAQAS